MIPEEYERMSRVEGTHWWYVGLRDVIRRTALSAPEFPATPRVLDAGCGTGGTLRMIFDTCRPAWLGGFDASELALECARRKVPEADIYRSDIRNPEVREGDLDLILSLDVIYVPGLEASRAGLQALVGQLRSGGRLVLHLPAYQWLTSEHDVAIHTSQRFVAGEVERLLDDLGLKVEWLSYRICALFPAVVLKRAGSILRVRRGVASAHSDLEDVPGPRLNSILQRIVLAENRLVARGMRMPFGSSVFAVGVKERARASTRGA